MIDASSSTNDFLDDTEGQIIDDSGLGSDNISNSSSSIDSRRRLEARLAERSLERDTQEFDFRF